MSWWTKHRKKLGLALGAIAAGAGAAPLAGLLGLGQSAAGAAGAGAGKLAGLLGQGGLTAGLVPGLSATGPGSQAAMLAAQNSGLGLDALIKTASAASVPGAGPNILGGIDGAMNGAKVGGQALSAMSALQPQSMEPLPAPPPPQPQPQQGPPPSPAYPLANSSPVGGAIPPGLLSGLPPEIIEELKKRGLI